MLYKEYFEIKKKICQTYNSLASDSINYYMFATFFICILFVVACETKLKEIYVKARNAEELKIHAFENCGKLYKVLSYEDDTARIKCLKQTTK